MSTTNNKEATSNRNTDVDIGDVSQQIKRARVESHDSNINRVSGKENEKYKKKQDIRLESVQPILESLPVDFLYDSCKTLASNTLSSAIRVHEGGLKIKTMLNQLSKDKVPSTIRYHEGFVNTYRKPNEDKWQSEYDKLNDKGKEILKQVEVRIVKEVFIPTKEVELRKLKEDHRCLVIEKLMGVSLVYSNYLANVEKFKPKPNENATPTHWDSIEIAQRAVENYVDTDPYFLDFIYVKDFNEFGEYFREHKSIDIEKLQLTKTPTKPPTQPPQDTSTDVNSSSSKNETSNDSNSDKNSNEDTSGSTTTMEMEVEDVTEKEVKKRSEKKELRIVKETIRTVEDFLFDSVPSLTYDLFSTYLNKEGMHLAKEATKAYIKKQKTTELTDEVANIVNAEQTVNSKTLDGMVEDKVTREFDRRNTQGKKGEKKVTFDPSTKNASRSSKVSKSNLPTPKNSKGGPKNQGPNAQKNGTNGKNQKTKQKSKSQQKTKTNHQQKSKSKNESQGPKQQTKKRKRNQDEGNKGSRSDKKRKFSKK